MKLLAESRINENTFEHFSQALLLLIITALKFSNTKTVGCLESLIVKDNIFLLLISACWSIISIILGYLQSVAKLKNGFLPVQGKLILSLFVLISCIARICGIIAFFVPSLGLMNVLMHWKMGKLNISSSYSDFVYDIHSNGTITTFEEVWWVFKNSMINCFNVCKKILTFYSQYSCFSKLSTLEQLSNFFKFLLNYEIKKWNRSFYKII